MVAIIRLAAIGAIALAIGCGEFEDPEIVIDLRALAVQVEPPEIVTSVDVESMTVDFESIDDVELCALIGDPVASRSLEYKMIACPPGNDGLCNETKEPSTVIVEGVVDDPEEAETIPRICGTLSADGNLLAILMESFSADDLLGFGGISAQVEIRVSGAGGGDAISATKAVRYAPQEPADRVANTNPGIASLAITRENDSEELAPLGRCRDVEPLEVGPGETIEIEPVEVDGSREDYVLPTIDGERRDLTENLSYQWLATAGSWSRFNSGGARDPFGNEPPIDSSWTAPEGSEVGAGVEIQMWIVQRDERGGGSWIQTCVRVTP